MKGVFSLLFSVAVCIASASAYGDLLPKDGDTFAFFGDSITQFGQQNTNGFVNLVLRELEVEGVKVVPIKAGRGGDKSTDLLARLDHDVLSKKPRWMTLSCGVNDVWHFYQGRGVPLEEYKTNITAILDKCAAANCTVIVLTPTMFESRECHHKALNEKIAPYNAWLREEAKRRKLPLADVNAIMWAAHEADPNVVLTRDGIHMGTAGDKLLAKGVLEALGARSEAGAVLQENLE